MGDFINAVQATFTIEQMWTTLVQVGAFIGTLILFAFSYRVIRKLIGGASKGKARI